MDGSGKVDMDGLKRVRESTKAGLADCKKDLQDAGGDVGAAAATLKLRQATELAERTGKPIEVCEATLESVDRDIDRAAIRLLPPSTKGYIESRFGDIKLEDLDGLDPMEISRLAHVAYNCIESVSDEAQTKAERCVARYFDLDTAVGGDGFHFFITGYYDQEDPPGEHILATKQALKDLGAVETLKLVEEAVRIASEANVEELYDQLDPIDRRYYALKEPVDELVVRYVLKNFKDFS